MLITAMQTLKIRIVGDAARAERLMNMIHEMDGVAQVEEIPLFDASPCTACHIEVAVSDADTAWRIRAFTAGAAMLLDASAEFVDPSAGESLSEASCNAG